MYGLESGRPDPQIARNERLLTRIRNLNIFAIAIIGVIGWHGTVVGFTPGHWVALALFAFSCIVTERARASISRNLDHYRKQPFRRTRV